MFPTNRKVLWVMPVLQTALLIFFTWDAVARFWMNWGLLFPAFVTGLLGGAVYDARFRQEFMLEGAIGSHACSLHNSLEANMRVTNGIPLGWPPLLQVGTANCFQTL